jgi:hypothetical protein
MDPRQAAASKTGGQKFLRMDPRKAAARIVADFLFADDAGVIAEYCGVYRD